MTLRQNRTLAHGRGVHRRAARRGVVVLVTGIAVLGTAGTAEAYFRTIGSGSGSAPTGTALALTGTGQTTAALYPVSSAADLKVTVNNPNSYSVVVSSITLNGSVTGCTTPAVTFTVAPADLPVTVPAGPGNTITLHGALTMGASASSDCQGKSLTVPLSLSGKSS